MTETVALKIVQRIATELTVQPRQVAAAVQLLDEGATVPFIARYRKEVTDNLDDTQLRNLEERLLYLRELEDRRAAILASIDEQGKLTDELRSAIEGADSKQVLGRPVSAVQAEAPHARADRPRSRSAAARRRAARQSAARPANRSRRVTWTPRKASPTSRPRSTARATFSPNSSAKRPNCSASCATICSTRAWCRRKWSKARKARKTRNSATTTTTPRRSAPCRRIARSRCFAAAMRAC